MTGLGVQEWWREHWKDMPEFIQEDLSPWRTVEVRVKNDHDLQEFLQVSGSKLYHGKWMWWPEQGYNKWRGKIYKTESPVLPKYPIYIPSKGRWKSRLTSKTLEKMGVPYYIVIEPHEYDNYSSVIDPLKILLLPWSRPDSNTELVPTRNWIWEHSLSSGAKRHWQIDDNIDGFYRLNKNVKRLVLTGAIFRAAEEFVDRYENIAQAGFQYELLMTRRNTSPPFSLNTRIYSCTLNLNSINHRYRDIYNDDTDMSLRVLKDGYCTVLFNSFLCNKIATMRVSGGNTPIYQKNSSFDGRLLMAQSLMDQHPDCVTITRKWGRWQHQVDYSRFKYNHLIMNPVLEISEGINEYGMQLVDLENHKGITL